MSTDQQAPVIFWFRHDLRLDDLPGLAAAIASGRPVFPCFIFDEYNPGDWVDGAASRWWLHNSLEVLAGRISELGGELCLLRGDSCELLAQLVEKIGAVQVFCSRQYEPWAVAVEQRLHERLGAVDVRFTRYSGSLLWEPEQIATRSGSPFKVFTPFWRRCRELGPPKKPSGTVDACQWWHGSIDSDALDDWSLRPSKPDWAQSWSEYWQPGEIGASERLRVFLSASIQGYGEGRDYPSRQATSLLSAHLHFGEISPNRVYHAAQDLAHGSVSVANDIDKFLSEVAWREFSSHLLTHFPSLPEQPFKAPFTRFPWVGSKKHLEAWQSGTTGYPIVDAGMRELMQTGYMHNRVRMVVASFLCKHLLIDWRAGQRWFWDTLVDADLANNSCSWQWVAGSGADASPFFRIFNPILQGAKFDAEGEYIRRWVPELSALENIWLNQPWEAPKEVLKESGIELGCNYPFPLVPHKQARESALAAYASIRESD
ncbi:MAG: deoxyribodipyrimidine photo-lyase [Halioglobus sp.]